MLWRRRDATPTHIFLNLMKLILLSYICAFHPFQRISIINQHGRKLVNFRIELKRRNASSIKCQHKQTNVPNISNAPNVNRFRFVHYTEKQHAKKHILTERERAGERAKEKRNFSRIFHIHRFAVKLPQYPHTGCRRKW